MMKELQLNEMMLVNGGSGNMMSCEGGGSSPKVTEDVPSPNKYIQRSMDNSGITRGGALIKNPLTND